ncbi:hypothetical protein [Cellulosimicrobium arenosum]|uniref:Uncharacterized protein n=1 Tax=Cellulosimicrobium arenosum TaxID=2708133 RepID=A0A927PGM7_9MICO|nr:hypothetical protein [Cellulosimicrobium arenosum]MBD8080778.1 hypothetical protein [Cellulosimicrobium arenosum]
MPKLSRTNVLTSLTALAGAIGVAGFVSSNMKLGAAALGVAAVLLAGLVHSVGRDIRAQLLGNPGDSRTLTNRIDESTDLLASKVDRVLTGQQKSAADAAARAEHDDAMARRVVADLGAARQEAAERPCERAR